MQPEPRLSPAEVAENDQNSAHAAETLDWYVASTRRTLAQAAVGQLRADPTEVLALIALTLIEAKREIPRDALASMLAVALVRLASAPEVTP